MIDQSKLQFESADLSSILDYKMSVTINSVQPTNSEIEPIKIKKKTRGRS